jgi:hypothetical protein
VARLAKALYDKKGKQIQPPQDNNTTGMNKPMEGETVICRLCHKEGHKSYQCKTKIEDKQNKSSSKSQQAKSLTPTSTRWTKRLLHHI